MSGAATEEASAKAPETALEKQQKTNKAGRVMTFAGNIAGAVGGGVTVGFSINAADKTSKLIKQVKACKESFSD
jgi:hypothetical protein